MKSIIRTVVLGAAALAAGWYLLGGSGAASRPAALADAGQRVAASDAASPQGPSAGGDAAREAFEQQAHGRMLRVAGRVQRLLADDRDGSPHQRFIIVTDTGQSLLVAHNLDLAPRLDGLAVGDTVSLYGEYEWNPQGGVMHWTHDDPRGNHIAGYIDWRGRRYQ